MKTLGLWKRSQEEETILPQNMKVYRELFSVDPKDFPNNRKRLQRNRSYILDNFEENYPETTQMAAWKRTSRATAKLIYR